MSPAATTPPVAKQHGDNKTSSRFIPKIPEIETLGTSTEQKGHN